MSATEDFCSAACSAAGDADDTLEPPLPPALSSGGEVQEQPEIPKAEAQGGGDVKTEGEEKEGEQKPRLYGGEAILEDAGEALLFSVSVEKVRLESPGAPPSSHVPQFCRFSWIDPDSQEQKQVLVGVNEFIRVDSGEEGYFHGVMRQKDTFRVHLRKKVLVPAEEKQSTPRGGGGVQSESGVPLSGISSVQRTGSFNGTVTPGTSSNSPSPSPAPGGNSGGTVAAAASAVESSASASVSSQSQQQQQQEQAGPPRMKEVIKTVQMAFPNFLRSFLIPRAKAQEKARYSLAKESEMIHGPLNPPAEPSALAGQTLEQTSPSMQVEPPASSPPDPEGGEQRPCGLKRRAEEELAPEAVRQKAEVPPQEG
uniref:Uncharacterized protein n=1 Tax=Chromera velia CCMP2878 TaxID=1169474 RepID=A0A0G4GCW0_9ALVE|mmetsp:Transcript_28831/g.56491  ORF Transcript_28831/g.56491 Transcript_28831/m.56491 type:complete len:368 (-) Transcript_28831:608-1711(-)|eukprot:Cvel_4481.t1-p1 / transcript=Cvel_4481.t1 / gene=Cvel_4481 / organism=Chromera_velia_CCMP2878 / gene_product=hypothetical protein / transcript_product=hypothetical protein / location=Cvel_scaffold196:24208-27617(+) / protein_length=367 / sequence_SO=supercontig / SO=protein_coding / is_pseudo=false